MAHLPVRSDLHMWARALCLPALQPPCASICKVTFIPRLRKIEPNSPVLGQRFQACRRASCHSPCRWRRRHRSPRRSDGDLPGNIAGRLQPPPVDHLSPGHREGMTPQGLVARREQSQWKVKFSEIAAHSRRNELTLYCDKNSRAPTSTSE